MNTSRKAVLVCALILMTSPLAGWADTKEYSCEYSKMEDNQRRDFGYDSYQASSVEDAEKQSRADPSNKSKQSEDIELECRVNEEE
ncbi:MULTISPECIES: hypothetical protein [Pseudomonas]|uniref:hypothetical protein n=1 Tax=Pseudomonas TaxID=286 RepID=UPI001F424990|nr:MULTISPECIES: hypothetical protein [Pseudomonas]MCE5981578.1 hypothetical protein [Pseudomonas sp. LF19]UVM19955.1 hypothetical protein LOY45_15975 [Pseudomonas wadenswilerensis]